MGSTGQRINDEGGRPGEWGLSGSLASSGSSCRRSERVSLLAASTTSAMSRLRSSARDRSDASVAELAGKVTGPTSRRATS